MSDHELIIAVKAKAVIAPIREPDPASPWTATVQIVSPTEGQGKVLGVLPDRSTAERAVEHWKQHTLPSLLSF
jgi:hypothetical protein